MVIDTFMAAGHDTTASAKWEKGNRGLGYGVRGGDGYTHGCRA